MIPNGLVAPPFEAPRIAPSAEVEVAPVGRPVNLNRTRAAGDDAFPAIPRLLVGRIPVLLFALLANLLGELGREHFGERDERAGGHRLEGSLHTFLHAPSR